MKIIGLPNHLTKYKMAYLDYQATGEGITILAEILNHDSQKLSLGYFYEPELIPCVIEKEFENQKYFDWNPEFKTKFYEVFGATMFEKFVTCCLEHNNFLTLKSEMHYNLS